MTTLPEPTPPPTAPRSLTTQLAWGAVFIFVFALLIMVAIGLRRTSEGPIVIGDEVPTDLVLNTFDGQQIYLKDLRGKVVLLNFWASWCKPCEQEAADLQAAWEYYEPTGQVVFLGVDYVDTEPEALGYLAKFNITYANGPDLGTKISQAFRIRGVPETYIIDQNGILASVMIGPYSSLSQIQQAIDPLLQP